MFMWTAGTQDQCIPLRLHICINPSQRHGESGEWSFAGMLSRPLLCEQGRHQAILGPVTLKPPSTSVDAVSSTFE